MHLKLPKKCVRNEGNSIGNTSPEWWKPAPHLHIQLSRPSPIYSRNLVSIQFPGHSSNFTIFPFIHQFVSYDWRQQQQMLFTPISLFFPSKLLLQFTKPLTAIINHEAFLFCFCFFFRSGDLWRPLFFPHIFSQDRKNDFQIDKNSNCSCQGHFNDIQSVYVEVLVQVKVQV